MTPIKHIINRAEVIRVAAKTSLVCPALQETPEVIMKAEVYQL